ncbi:Uncharacterised protein [Mycobacteroides abscessus subsp. abscessus]|nr:Uncharacterised protein [Mycobacteroides abscessus subsp. abscessus]
MNADAVHLIGRYGHHMVGLGVPADERKQRLAHLLGELLRVVERGETLTLIGAEHTGRDHQRTRAGPTSRLVHAGDRA